MNRYIALLLLICATSFAHAQKRYTGNEAADKVQRERDKAWEYFDKKGATPAEINKGIRILTQAIALLDTPYVKELALNNSYLYYRRQDAVRDLASGYALAGKKDSAIWALKQIFFDNGRSTVAALLRKDSTFNSLRGEPEFEKLVAKYENKGALWTNKALNTPYKGNISDAEKLAGLSLLWSQAKYNFVNFDHLDIDWNQLYLDYIPKVQHTTSTIEYYKVLMTFYAQLKDGHTNVYPPDTLDSYFYSRPPFRTELIEGRVFVSQVLSDSLLRSGIVPGLEVVRLDGEPVITYAEKNVKPYQSASTPQDMEVREFTYGLLSGPKERSINFEFKDKHGKTITRTISRSGYHDIKYPPTLTYQTINGIGYLTINDFEDNRIVKQFDSLYNAEISKTKGLIIDVRHNGGGSGSIGFNIIGRLTNKPFQISRSRRLIVESKPNAESYWQDLGASEWQPNGKILYDKPVVVLIGPRTFSAAEDFTVAFDYLKRGKLVGMPTGGSTGQPVPFDLPGGGSARICGKRDTYPDGKEFVGVGIMPDVMVKRTIKELQEGKDAAKEKALSMLK